MKLLIIEDDKLLSDDICEITSNMFNAVQAFDGEQGLFLAEQNIFDVIILDIMMPFLNGYQVLHELRQKNIKTPVLILTAKDSIDDKIKGFKNGADDYLVKPFHRQELLLRLEAIVRRSAGNVQMNMIEFRELSLNLSNKTVEYRGHNVSLNGKQSELLEYLIYNKNTILTKEQIFDRIWGFDSDTSTTVVEVYASHLRKLLKQFGYDQYLKTFRGLGYMLTENGDDNG